MSKECLVYAVLLFSVGMVVGMSIPQVDARMLVTKEQLQNNRIERRAIERKYQTCVATCQDGCVKKEM